MFSTSDAELVIGQSVADLINQQRLRERLAHHADGITGFCRHEAREFHTLIAQGETQ